MQTNQVWITKRQECLTKHDLTQVRGSDVEKKDPECYAILKELKKISGINFNEMRVLKALDSAPEGFFLSLHENQLGQIPEKSILNRNINYDVKLKDTLTDNRSESQAYPLDDDEVQQAIYKYALFMKKNCEDFVELNKSKKDYQTFNFEKFCESIFKNKISDIRKHTLGPYVLQTYSKYLKSYYLQKFRPYIRSSYLMTISQRPYLTLIRGPETFSQDLVHSINYAYNSSVKTFNDLKNKKAEINYNDLISKYEKGMLTPYQAGELKDFLIKDLEFEKIVQGINIKNDSVDPVTFKKLVAEYESNKSRNSNLSLAGQGLLMLACFIPPSKMAYIGLGSVVNSLTKLGLTSFQISLLCAVVTQTPISVYQTIDSVIESQRLHDLLFSQADGIARFSDFEKLEEIEKAKLINYFFVMPLEFVATVQLVKGLYPLGQQSLKALLNKMKSQKPSL